MFLLFYILSCLQSLLVERSKIRIILKSSVVPICFSPPSCLLTSTFYYIFTIFVLSKFSLLTFFTFVNICYLVYIFLFLLRLLKVIFHFIKSIVKKGADCYEKDSKKRSIINRYRRLQEANHHETLW